ncbi:MazG nucleotide pyrophosphohydrolase domain-containing protein [Brevibacterium album]|uniref:MazG nucleotide pyrophosphohydrolase domain-containing protein n=1 Tax=Brevibacterium album TaxID=417948 RepID=UPI0004270C6A|nr:MazG nucleotide pyrophosphohydrolase domain-containing protein [Brevibacterium album]
MSGGQSPGGVVPGNEGRDSEAAGAEARGGEAAGARRADGEAAGGEAPGTGPTPGPSCLKDEPRLARREGGSPDPRDVREPWARPETEQLDLPALMAFIRARCPWASAHTHVSLSRYLVEESAELLAAEEHLYGRPADGAGTAHDAARHEEAVDGVEGELADVLYQVLFHSALLDDHEEREPGETYARVETRLAAKLVRRHPHVFDSEHPVPLEQVQCAYRGVKDREKRTGLSAPEPPVPAQVRALALVRDALAVTEHRLGEGSAPRWPGERRGR